MLSPDILRLVREQRLGFVATVNADGTPNLSPKGTVVVIGPATIAFAEIRSPNTLANLAARPAIEVNVVDAFSRRGCRLFGTARIVPRHDPCFGALLPHFDQFGDLMARARAVVLIDVSRALPLASPVYDDGAAEDGVRRFWTARFRAQQPGGQFPP